MTVKRPPFRYYWVPQIEVSVVQYSIHELIDRAVKFA